LRKGSLEEKKNSEENEKEYKHIAQRTTQTRETKNNLV